MTRPSLAMILTWAVLGTACGDDDGSASSTADSSTGGSTNTGTDGPSTTTSTDPDSSTGPGPGTSGSSDSGLDSTGATMGTGTDTDTDTDTAGVDCEAIAPGPLTVETVFEPGEVFDGSEDIVFDGQGNLLGKNGAEVVAVAADGSVVDAWADQGGTYGLRFRANGDLLAAKYQSNLIRIVQSGAVLVDDAGGVNGLAPDLDGNVWFTNFSSVQRVNPDDSVDSIVTGPDAAFANGVLFDPDRSMLFFTNYNAGIVYSVEIMGDGSPGEVSMVAQIPFASSDGINMDVCGNLYVVDQGSARLHRVFLDEAGAAVGGPEELLGGSFPSNVANAVWGSGPGWDANSLYVAGVPGGVYRVEVGVPGLPSPTP